MVANRLFRRRRAVRGHRRLSPLAAAALTGSLAALLLAAPARAGLRQELSLFSDCPIATPGVTACLVSKTTSGEFKLGSKTVPINKTVTLQGGVSETSPDLVPAADGNTLPKTPLTVPGGLVGIEGLGGEVTATAELAGPVALDLPNLGTNQPAVSLPLKVKLDNPTLGSACYIGSDSEPVTLQLTSGTTSPPPPNKPITGSAGTLTYAIHGKAVVFAHTSLVDNSFPAPGVNGCGGLLSPVIDPVVDLDAGLPAAAGSNTAILNGSFELATVRLLNAEAALPSVGRCELAEVKEGTPRGRYEASNCVEENPHPLNRLSGKYEWLGVGAQNKFAGAGGATRLETAGKTTMTCSKSTSAGQYSGPKSVNASLTLTGCKLPASKASCHSAGAAPGEVVTPALDGELGFITDAFEGENLQVSVGLDLKGAPTLLAAECGSGSGKVTLSIAGSVIASITKVDKMSPKFALKFEATGANQVPEQFEEGSKDTLTSTSTGPSGTVVEQAGLSATESIVNEGPLEIKAIAK